MASGLDLVFNALCGRVEAVVGIMADLSKTLLVGVCWRGVDLVVLTRSTSGGFLAFADSEGRPAVEDAGSVLL